MGAAFVSGGGAGDLRQREYHAMTRDVAYHISYRDAFLDRVDVKP